jgi:hypothetical protein
MAKYIGVLSMDSLNSTAHQLIVVGAQVFEAESRSHLDLDLILWLDKTSRG